MYVPTPVSAEAVVDELLHLRPGVRIVVGAGIAVLGVVIDVMLWQLGWIWGFSVFAVLIGVVAIGSGVLAMRHLRRMRADVERALGQWEELRRELERARREKEGVGKALTRLGYRDHDVRTWIRQQLGIDAPAAPPPDNNER